MRERGGQEGREATVIVADLIKKELLVRIPTGRNARRQGDPLPGGKVVGGVVDRVDMG